MSDEPLPLLFSPILIVRQEGVTTLPRWSFVSLQRLLTIQLGTNRRLILEPLRSGTGQLATYRRSILDSLRSDLTRQFNNLALGNS